MTLDELNNEKQKTIEASTDKKEESYGSFKLLTRNQGTIIHIIKNNSILMIVRL